MAVGDAAERLDALTTRVDAIEPELVATRRVADDAQAEARTAMQAHAQNVRLLTAIRATQAEHGAVLREHGAVLAEHGTLLAEHERILGRILVGIRGIERTLTRLVERDDG